MLIYEKFRNPGLQVALAVIVSCIGTYVFTIAGTRTMANAVWLFVLPALIGIAFNDGKSKQIVMAGALMAVSALSAIAFMVAVWGGY